ncbi:MAG TPA: xanthine dehydrogenase family protein subunit M [Porticoccaceae bacterium]|nr:xanthine dehydrogenase family protein subunit M [Porticoccaceae bacterium]
MSNFQYMRASALDEAAAKVKGAEDGAVLAGGMTLLPSIKLGLSSPSDLVDLGGIGDLAGITSAGGSVTIGAMTCHADVANSGDVPPALAAMASGIGDRQVRNRGTIGGSIANNDPAADYPAACLALGATINTDQRSIAADDFFTGLFETALNDGEIITSVSFPTPDKAAYQKFTSPASRFALVGVFVAAGSDGVRVAVTGCGQGGVYRDADLESALAASFSADALADKSVSSDNLLSDIHAAADYRAHLIVEMTKRAVAACG